MASLPPHRFTPVVTCRGPAGQKAGAREAPGWRPGSRPVIHQRAPWPRGCMKAEPGSRTALIYPPRYFLQASREAREAAASLSQCSTLQRLCLARRSANSLKCGLQMGCEGGWGSFDLIPCEFESPLRRASLAVAARRRDGDGCQERGFPWHHLPWLSWLSWPLAILSKPAVLATSYPL